MSQYFPKPYEPFAGDYATKPDIKNISYVHTSSFALKSNLFSLKAEYDKLVFDKLKNKQIKKNLSKLKSKVCKLDIDKSVPVPVDLSKLSDVVKNDVAKNVEYNAKIKHIEDKIPDITNLNTKTILITKRNQVKSKIPSISGLATTSALTFVENKIPNVSNLTKETD